MARYRNDLMRIDSFSAFLSGPFYRFYYNHFLLLLVRQFVLNTITSTTSHNLFILPSYFVSWQQNNDPK